MIFEQERRNDEILPNKVFINPMHIVSVDEYQNTSILHLINGDIYLVSGKAIERVEWLVRKLLAHQ